MASPTISKARSVPKRRLPGINNLGRDTADGVEPSYTRIPSNANLVSRLLDDYTLQQPSASLPSKYLRPGPQKRATLNELPDSSRIYARHTSFVDSESDFDRADDSETSSVRSSSSKTCEEVKVLRRELALLQEKQEHLLRADARKMRELKQACDDVQRRSLHLSEQLEKMQAVHSKLKEHFQCQICLEPLKRPWTLSPCGHVACLECLLNWFKTPRADEDADQPDLPLYRTKTCPQCRVIVVSRPTPSFILKNIVEEMQAVNLLDPPVSGPNEVASTEDPWIDVFPDPCSCAAELISPHDGDPSELTADLESDILSIDSPSGSEADQADNTARREHANHVMGWEIDMRNSNTGGWVAPRWEPPRFNNSSIEVTNEDVIRLNRGHNEIISLLRRGATKQMIAMYQLNYDHDLGIIVYAGRVRVQLGWNISRNADDIEGRAYMQNVMDEMARFPERFGVVQLNAHTARFVVRLVPSLGTSEDDNGSVGSWTSEDSLD